MAKDAQGNDLKAVEIPNGGAMAVVDYDEKNKITREAMAASKAVVDLPESYGSDAFLGLITSDGGFEDGRDSDDAIEFFQPGYSMPASPTLTTTMTVAENNTLIRKLTMGEPDENGVYAVDDIIQPGKHCAFRETPLKDGRILRRAGVVQLTGNEPGKSTRGEVTGRELTFEWVEDPLYEGHKYFESIYDPATGTTTPSTGTSGSKTTTTAKTTEDTEEK